MSNPRPVRYVVFHKPGPNWQYGFGFREQDAGGMMVATRDVSQEELEAFAASDPAVRSGLLVYEVRPWLTAMEHERRKP